MFFRLLKYNLLCVLRNVQGMFWMLAFPVILGTFFYVAFGELYESEELFSSVPVAVVYEQDNEMFRTTTEALSDGDDALFEITETDGKKALKLLESGDVNGVIFVRNDISLSVKGDGIYASIIKSFLDQYLMNEKIITEAVQKDPLKAKDIIEAISSEVNAVKEKSFSDGNPDPYVQYFYNLITMSCLFGSMAGLKSVTDNQGNLSAIGARKCVSPVHKLKSITASLLSFTFANFICAALALSYLIFVLGVNFGTSVLPLYAIIAVGSFTGVTLGFMIGSIGRASESIKFSVTVSVVMLMCFLSGLMIGNMYAVVEKNAPWFNKISPAALLTDSFYSLNIYGGGNRLTTDIATLLILSAVFTLTGFFMTRRQKYASL